MRKAITLLKELAKIEDDIRQYSARELEEAIWKMEKEGTVISNYTFLTMVSSDLEYWDE